ncbi:hypothetical protein BT93_K1410 [Corymbia citriodora subsp. variegata]|nr:hypothetical protein BT93_K1410 [Corymbia citriodora subsp. variegata]
MHIQTMKIISNSVFQILLLLVSLTVRASGAATGLAKPHCAEKCGNVTIPFPFGIERRCFLDDWYEIVCQLNHTIPILNKIGLRVLNISLFSGSSDGSGTINVSLPLNFANESCQGIELGDPVNLEGSGFVFSQRWNVFTSVGCDTNATVTSKESAGMAFTSTGCWSKCAVTNTNFSWHGACSGVDGCCQTTLPLNLQAFEVDIKAGGQQGCNYAFLADKSWFSNLKGLYDLRLNDAVPVVLEWGIRNDTNYYPELIQSSLNSYFDCHTSDLPYMQCRCFGGYAGNPYILGGCQDINECEDSNICRGRGGTCVNREGDYDCVDGRETAKFILIVFGAVVGGLVHVLLLSRWLYKVIKKRRETKQKEKYFKTQWGLLLQQHLLSSHEGNVAKSKLFRFKDLEKATDCFNKNRILGQGGQGVVYKGMLADGKIVAVKKSKLIDNENIQEFINEVIILSQINHRNVVKLMGCCLETDMPLLVYEFIPNGTLYKYLQDPNEDLLTSWEARLRIATQIAGALFYLHSAASIPIYHRDIKSTNILLDEKHHAKVADFGISKSVSLHQTHVTTLVRGTFGYLDPEYFRTGHFTDKSDVYSFGVVLVELLTGQMPISLLRAEEERSLADYFVISMEQNCLLDIVDARVMEEGKKEEIVAVADLARRCLSSIGRNRPTMKEVAMALEGIMKPRSSSSFQRNQEKIEAAESRDSRFASGKSFVDTGVTTFSDVQPLAHCESW